MGAAQNKGVGATDNINSSSRNTNASGRNRRSSSGGCGIVVVLLALRTLLLGFVSAGDVNLSLAFAV